MFLQIEIQTRKKGKNTPKTIQNISNLPLITFFIFKKRTYHYFFVQKCPLTIQMVKKILFLLMIIFKKK